LRFRGSLTTRTIRARAADLDDRVAVTRLVATSRLAASPDDVFAWHARPGALERLTPPWERVRVIAREGTIHDGDRVELELRAALLRRRWTAVHRGFVDGTRFEDVQESGPFRSWRHAHRIERDGDGTRLTDEIDYELPLGGAGRALAGGWARRRLARMFAHRHRVLAEDLARHRGIAPLRIAVTGASGLIGSALSAFLATGGHTVVPLSIRGGVDEARLDGVDAVVHLAGENIGARWTPSRKQRIFDSRVNGTRAVAEALARLRRPPRVLVSASAVGFYGDRPGDYLTHEESPAGGGFLAELCVAWEAAARPAGDAGIRVVHPRFGVVLTPAGGALGKMLPAFRAGVGGRIGSGRQVLSWIGLDDVLYALLHLIVTDGLRGPVNLVAPEPVTNRELTRTLATVLRRPAKMPLPAPAVKLLFGEMGREALLGGQRVEPRRLLASGFRFSQPTLDGALRSVLGRSIGWPESLTLEVIEGSRTVLRLPE
jgi:uncharacterized protein (TIGR01777 family)